MFSIPLTGITVWTYSSSVEYDCVKRAASVAPTYTPPPPGDDGIEYVIDVGNVSKTPAFNADGFAFLPGEQVVGDASRSAAVTADGSALTLTMAATSRACFKGAVIAPNIFIDGGALAGAIAGGLLLGIDPGTLTFLGSLAVTGDAVLVGAEKGQDAIAYAALPKAINTSPASLSTSLQVFLRSKEPVVETGKVDKTFFMTTRGLCCCKDRHGDKYQEGVVYEGTKAFGPPSDAASIPESDKLRVALRHEMIRSLVSGRRTAPRSFAQTQLAVEAILPILLKDPVARATLRQRSADFVPDRVAAQLTGQFRESLKYLTRLDLLKMNVSSLAAASELNEDAVHELRTAMLAKPFERPDVLQNVEWPGRPEDAEQPELTWREPGGQA